MDSVFTREITQRELFYVGEGGGGYERFLIIYYNVLPTITGYFSIDI